jgi:flavin-dependent dehydrogenase
MNNNYSFDVAIVGGGLAGLSIAIMLSKKDFHVALFEKEKYPFHKVCGEYISLESKELLISLGIPFEQWQLPIVNHLSLTSPDGTELQQKLPLGGFGVSRYKIDEELKNIAEANGVKVFDGSKVNDVSFADEKFALQTDAGIFSSAVCCISAGKRSNIDVKWKREFVVRKPNKLNNFIAVKYHVQLEHPRNLIALHNFNGGYCGISPVENNRTCICYLTTAENLRKSSNDIKKMERDILSRNVFIKDALENSTMLYEKPLTISQVSFDKKEQVHDHALLLGDSAGLIAPLCGNGMSMALFSSVIATPIITDFLQHKISRSELEQLYTTEWNKSFGSRLKAGRIIQSLFGKEWLTNTSVSVLRHFPSLVRRIIRLTHG